MIKAFFGHHKCASTWIVHILLKISGEKGWRHTFAKPYRSAKEDLNQLVASSKADLLICQEAIPENVSLLKNFKGFHVTRDPRDIIVSAYFSHMHSHTIGDWTALEEHRKQLKRVDQDEGLFLEMDNMEGFLSNLVNWQYNDPNILELKMEDLIQDPINGFIEIFEHIGALKDKKDGSKEAWYYPILAYINRVHRKTKGLMPLNFSSEYVSTVTVKRVVQANSFKKMAKGRTEGQEDVRSHYRKGIAGDWINHMNKEHIQYFKSKYNDLLIKLEYENDVNWDKSLDLKT